MSEKNFSDDVFNITRDESKIFDIYQILVEMADRTSSRRLIANTFFLTINAAIITTLVALLGHNYFKYLWILNILTIVINWTWLNHIKSSKLLNGAKYKVIQEVEKRLYVNAYTSEWNLLTKNKTNHYKRFSSIESRVPKTFLIFNGLALILTACLHIWH